jgi:hypothetical protein
MLQTMRSCLSKAVNEGSAVNCDGEDTLRSSDVAKLLKGDLKPLE